MTNMVQRVKLIRQRTIGRLVFLFAKLSQSSQAMQFKDIQTARCAVFIPISKGFTVTHSWLLQQFGLILLRNSCLTHCPSPSRETTQSMTVDEENKNSNLFFFWWVSNKKKNNFSKTGCQLMTATKKSISKWFYESLVSFLMINTATRYAGNSQSTHYSWNFAQTLLSCIVKTIVSPSVRFRPLKSCFRLSNWYGEINALCSHKILVLHFFDRWFVDEFVQFDAHILWYYSI